VEAAADAFFHVNRHYLSKSPERIDENRALVWKPTGEALEVSQPNLSLAHGRNL